MGQAGLKHTLSLAIFDARTLVTVGVGQTIGATAVGADIRARVTASALPVT